MGQKKLKFLVDVGVGKKVEEWLFKDKYFHDAKSAIFVEYKNGRFFDRTPYYHRLACPP